MFRSLRVRSQAPLTEVSPFWRKYMRPLLCLIFFRSFGSLPPPCCDRTVRNSDAHALCRRRDKPSPIGVRYSGRSRGLSQMRQVVPYRRSLFRRSAMNCLSPYASLFTSCVNRIRSLRLPLAATFAKLLHALSTTSILQRSPGHKHRKPILLLHILQRKIHS